MAEKVLTWFLDLISNPLFVTGLLLIFIASFLKDEKSVESGKAKPAALFKAKLRPLPVWGYYIFIVIGLLVLLFGILQISDLIGPTAEGVSLSPVAQDILKLDDLPFLAFSYGLGNDFIDPQHFSYLSVINDSNSIIYRLNFSMPLQGDAAAGTAFALSRTIDLTNYSYIELAARFQNSQCDLYLEDPSGNGAYVTISDVAPASIEAIFADGYWQFRIPLTNYNAIDLSKVAEVGCNALRCEGQCMFEVGEIQFSK